MHISIFDHTYIQNDPSPETRFKATLKVQKQIDSHSIQTLRVRKQLTQVFSPKTPLVGFHLEEHYFKNTCKRIFSCVLEFLVGFTTGRYHFLKTLKLGIISSFIFTMASHHKSFHLHMVTTLEFSKAMTMKSKQPCSCCWPPHFLESSAYSFIILSFTALG